MSYGVISLRITKEIFRLVSTCTDVLSSKAVKLQNLKVIKFKYNLLSISCILTHIGLASYFWDKGKQCRPRSVFTVCQQEYLFEIE